MYKRTMTLNNDEVLCALNKSTGEIREDKKKPNNIPDGKEKFEYDASFTKSYQKTWEYLADCLTPVELKIALMMSSMTEYSTNSLSPLDNNVSYEMLADRFKISKGSVKKAFQNLFNIGVYASFKYSHYRRGTVEEWVFNPFISFKGKLIDSDLKNLFLNTKIAKRFFISQ